MPRPASRLMVVGAVYKAVQKAMRPGGPSLGDRASALPRMAKAVASGDYVGVSKGRLALMAAAAGYIASPIDLIPEAFAPVLGLADDAVVLGWLATQVVEETEAFLEWERSVGRSPSGPGRGRRPGSGVGGRRPGPGRRPRGPLPAGRGPRRAPAGGRRRARPCAATSSTTEAHSRLREWRAGVVHRRRPRGPSSTDPREGSSRHPSGTSVVGMTADITLRGPDEVIAVLPYQLGYHPRDSVVAVALRGRTMGMVARADLPPEEYAAEVAATLVGPLVRDGATSVVVVAWEDAPDASTAVTLALVEQLEGEGVEVLDVAVVRDGRRFSPICAERCCPPDGEALRDPSTVPAVAELVALGKAPLASRDDVDRLVDPGPRAESLGRVLATRATRAPGRRRWARAWAEVLGADPTAPVRDAALADAVLSLADIHWRDGLLAWLSPGVLSLQEVDDEVVRRLRTTVPQGPSPGERGPAVRTDGAVAAAAPRRAVPGRARRVHARGRGDLHGGRPRRVGRGRRGHRPGGPRPGPTARPRVPVGGAARPARRRGGPAAARSRPAARGRPAAVGGLTRRRADVRGRDGWCSGGGRGRARGRGAGYDEGRS